MTALDDVAKKKPAEQSAEQEAALSEELTEHPGYEKNDRAGQGSQNIRNGNRSKTVLTDSSGQVEIVFAAPAPGKGQVLDGGTDRPARPWDQKTAPLWFAMR